MKQSWHTFTGWALLMAACMFLPCSSARAQDEAERYRMRVIRLEGNYVDLPGESSFDPTSLLLGGITRQRSFFRLCEVLDELAADETIQGLFLDLSAPIGMNLAQATELRRHLVALQMAGKDTFAWLESAESIRYLLATACESVMIADFGMLDLPSLSLETMHFKDAMDQFGVQASIARVGEWKGAVEPYTSPAMSPHLRNHYRLMLETMNDHMVESLADGRLLPVSDLRRLQGLRIFTAAEAETEGLVDHLVPYGHQRERVAELLVNEIEWVTASRRARKSVNFWELLTELMGGPRRAKSSEPTVAVLHLSGEIVDGTRAQGGAIVSEPMVKEIRELKNDEWVQAVVLRVNSPGGSATASEAIRQALIELAAVKPVVVSMGSLAASGGYWVSCLGRPIYAEATTITGSIGVFAMKLTFGPLLRRIGVQIETVSLDESAGAMSLARPWNEQELDRIRMSIDGVYERFLTLVEDSRGLDRDCLDTLAGGRVWSGAQAWALGLVDHLGGLDDAVAAAVDEAELEGSYEIAHYPAPRPPFDLMELLGNQGDDVIRAALASPSVKALRSLGFDLGPVLRLARRTLEDPTPRVWALLPLELRVR